VEIKVIFSIKKRNPVS